MRLTWSSLFIWLILQASALVQSQGLGDQDQLSPSVLCENDAYQAVLGERVSVCFVKNPIGDLSFVSVNVSTVRVRDNGREFPGSSLFVSFRDSLPCIGVMISDPRVLKIVVLIHESSSLLPPANCTVYLMDPPEDDTTGSPQRGEAIAGGVVGGLIGLVGVSIAVVTLVAVYLLYCRGDKSIPSSTETPRPVRYRKNQNGDLESNVSDNSTRYEPANNTENNTTQLEDLPPVSPIYTSVEQTVDYTSVERPEDYEVPISLSQVAGEEGLEYEVPLRRLSDERDHHYHTLEPPKDN